MGGKNPFDNAGWWDDTTPLDWWSEIAVSATPEPDAAPIPQPAPRRQKSKEAIEFARLNRDRLGKSCGRLYRAKLVEDAKSRGLCLACLKRPARPRKKDGLPSSRCQECYDKYVTKWLEAHPFQTRRAARVRQAKQNLGFCRQAGCESMAIPGRTLCGYHAEQEADGDAARYQRLRERHESHPDQCFFCENPLSPNSKRYCAEHLAAHNERTAKYRSSKKAKEEKKKCA